MTAFCINKHDQTVLSWRPITSYHVAQLSLPNELPTSRDSMDHEAFNLVCPAFPSRGSLQQLAITQPDCLKPVMQDLTDATGCQAAAALVKDLLQMANVGYASS